MATRHFCDRCDAQKEERKLTIVGIRPRMGVFGDGTFFDHSAQLCASCLQAFKQWLKGEVAT